MKKFTNILSYVVVIALGVAFFYGMAHAQFGAATSTADIGVAWAGAQSGNSIMGIIKVFINWVLGLLSLIALVVCLYGGFSMVTAAGDEAKYKSGFKILQQAAVGLAIIGLSWIIVSAVFRIIWGAAGNPGTAGQTIGGGIN